MLVHLPAGHVGGLAVAAGGLHGPAEDHVQHERPVVAHHGRDHAQGPQQLGDGGRGLLDDLPDLVALVWVGRVRDAHPQLVAGEPGGDRTDLDAREGRPEGLVVGLLDLHQLGHRLQQEARLQGRKLPGQAPAVVGELDHVVHDLRGLLLAEAGGQARVLPGEARRGAGEVQGRDGDAVGLQAGGELDRLARAHDAVGPGDHHAAPVRFGPEHLVHHPGGFHRQGPALEDAQHRTQAQGLKRRLSQCFFHFSSPHATSKIAAMPTSPAAQPVTST